MANYDTRRVLDYRFDQLSSSVTALDTTLQSAGFATLPSDLSAEKYIPVVLADDALKLYETVWITGHSAASQSVTVVRGREGSTARAWASGGLWRVAPTMRDVLSTVATRAALPADAHIGMRVMIESEDAVVERTSMGWASQLGGASIRHVWSQSNNSLIANTVTTATGLTAVGGNGTVATLSAGQLLLNSPGIWALHIHMVIDNGAANGSWRLILSWPGGGFGPTSEAVASAQGLTGYAGSGYGACRIDWTDYVSDAWADSPISVKVLQNNATTTAVTIQSLVVIADYLGG